MPSTASPVRHRVPGLAAALLLGLLASAPAAAESIDVFREIDQSNPNTGRANLAPSQFNFNPDLSTFQADAVPPVQKACKFRFTVDDLAPFPPEAGVTVGNVDGLEGYTALFDNDPAGHWGIRHPEGVTAMQARVAVSTYAKANRDRVVNGTANNCN